MVSKVNKTKNQKLKWYALILQCIGKLDKVFEKYIQITVDSRLRDYFFTKMYDKHDVILGDFF